MLRHIIQTQLIYINKVGSPYIYIHNIHTTSAIVFSKKEKISNVKSTYLPKMSVTSTKHTNNRAKIDRNRSILII